ncbi:MAG: zeta toxin family protein [Lactobacillaceae bacterium]|nr:zeta toxin family protein [Lactobacillaceae bacterium]
MKIEDFSETEFNDALSELIDDLIENRTKVENPKAYLLGGQSGSGKTTIHEIIRESLNKNIIVIDGDTFRKLHPRSEEITEIYGVEDTKYTSYFAGKMVEALVEHLSKHNYNLVIEGTLRTTDVPLETAKLLKIKKYNVSLYGMAVKPAMSYLSTLQRYEEMYVLNTLLARATPKEHHDLIVANYAQNLDQIQESILISNVRLVSRYKEIVYDDSIIPHVLPSEFINAYWKKTWSQSEKEMLEDIYERTHDLMMDRNAAELAQLEDWYLETVLSLRNIE